MGKRGNDANQESKEEYEARERREGLLGGNNQDDGFSRASKETIKTRRIIRVSSKWKRNKTAGAGSAGSVGVVGVVGAGSAGSTGAGAGVGVGVGGMGGGLSIRTPTIPSAPTSTNPFANTILPPSKSIMSSNSNGNSGDTDSKPNPFASVSFASATPAKNTTTFKFGGGNSSDVPSTTKRTKTDTTTTGSSLFQFKTSSTNTNISTSTSQPSKSQSPKNKNNNAMPQLRDGAKENDSIPLSEKTLLNLSMLRMAQLEYQANPLSDWTEWMKKYTAKVETVEKEEDCARQVAVQEKASLSSTVTATSTATTTTTTTGNVKPFTGFSFASSSTSVTTTSAPTPVPAPAPTPAPATATTSNDKDAPNYQELLKPDQVLKTINEDEIELYECKAKYRKQITSTTDTNKKEWKSYSAGTLRITKSKSNHTYQLVIRDLNVGKVQFNISLSQGMNFNKPVVSKGKASILFVAVQDPKKGAELFALIVKMEDKDGLYGILSSIGAGSA